MPTYEYVCQACGHQFEEFQSITAAAIRKCPSCRKLKAKRLIGTGAGIIFKGSGFYCTDYRDKAYRSSASKDKPADSDSSVDKSPSKPAAPEAKTPKKAQSKE